MLVNVHGSHKPFALVAQPVAGGFVEHLLQHEEAVALILEAKRKQLKKRSCFTRFRRRLNLI